MGVTFEIHQQLCFDQRPTNASISSSDEVNSGGGHFVEGIEIFCLHSKLDGRLKGKFKLSFEPIPYMQNNSALRVKIRPCEDNMPYTNYDW